MSTVRMFLEVISVVGIIHTWRLALQSWAGLPDRIPIHFGFSGKPDGWGKKGFIWLFPAMAVLVYAAMSITSFLPATFNYPVPINAANAARQLSIALTAMATMKAEIVWLSAYGVWKTIRTVRGEADGLGAAFVPAFIFIMFATLAPFVYLAYQAK